MIEKNKEYIVNIEDMTYEGMGVAKIDNFPIFIESAITGEKIKIKIVKVLKNFAYGKVMEIIEKSLDRIEPFCPMYKRCGGCNIQHMSYDATLKLKKNIVQNNLKRIAGLDIEVEDVKGMTEPYNYRNKAQYPVGIQNNEVVVGFYSAGSHNIVPNMECGIQSKFSGEVIKAVKEYIIDNRISVYNEETKKGVIRHVVIRNSEKTGESMLIVVINSSKKLEGIKEYLNSKKINISTIVQNINMKNTNVILGEKNIVLSGKGYITDMIGNLRFKISPHSFFQVNKTQTEVLYNTALEMAGLTGNEVVYDLYCGTGTISLFLAQKAKKVYGVEIVAPAIENAKENAIENDIQNVEFICGKSEEVIFDIKDTPDTVVVDPPRAGCDVKLIKEICRLGPEKMVYVSCNPATLARDIKEFEGYEVKKVVPVDMFCWSNHVETVVLLQNEKL